MFYEISRKQRTYTFTSTGKPCLTIEAGDYVLFHTQDAHSGTVNTDKVWSDVPFPELDENTGNPVIGLVFVKGARRGTTLRVTIVDIVPEEIGILPIRSYMGVLRDIVPERTARVVRYEDNRIWISDKISIPARPMIGTIGVAPKEPTIATAYPGNHGGNLDDNFVTTGSNVYLPVYHDGAYFGIGDIHASMGEGELTCGGADICAHVIVKVDVLSEPLLTENPIVVKDNIMATHGFAQFYPDAARMASEEMCRILMNKMHIPKYEAVLLMGARGDLGLCQACESGLLPMVVRLAFPIIW